MMRPGNEVIDRALGWLEATGRKPVPPGGSPLRRASSLNPSPYCRYRARPMRRIAFVMRGGRVLLPQSKGPLRLGPPDRCGSDHCEGLASMARRRTVFLSMTPHSTCPYLQLPRNRYKIPFGRRCHRPIPPDLLDYRREQPQGSASRILVSSYGNRPHRAGIMRNYFRYPLLSECAACFPAVPILSDRRTEL